jgi:hypothetical protein
MKSAWEKSWALFLCPKKGGESVNLKIICAWCGRFMRFNGIPESDEPRLPISHSICPACKKNLEREIEILLPTSKPINNNERR